MRSRLRTPAELYRASPRKYKGTPEDLEYLNMCTRRVSQHGMIKMDAQALFLTTALAGWSVGLKPVAPEVLEVWFGRLLLGQVDLTTSSFIRADLRLNKDAKSGGFPPE